jgi:uncharacterized protein YndB with AHSA1/START domain
MKNLVHNTFVVERTYPNSPAQIFAAFADPEAKSKWFAGPPGTTAHDKSGDFRVGGGETVRTVFPDGKDARLASRYCEIVPDRRIVYTYEMWINGEDLSVSIATIEIVAEAKGTRLVITEAGAFLGSQDDATSREQGTNWLTDNLGPSLPPA